LTAARRFFVEGTASAGERIEITGGDAHKIAHVLRLREGDEIAVVDSTAHEFSATLVECGRVVLAEVGEEIERRAKAPALAIDLAQAVPKGSRMDFVIEKGTELGVAAFVPFFSERCVGQSAGEAKVARWQRLAKTAAQQCGRSDVPAIEAPATFQTMVRSFSRYDLVLFAWELAEPQSLTERLGALLPSAGKILVVVGPEGGFSHAEAESAAEQCADLIWLGPRVLRTDTAALVLLAVIGAIAS
jgi:16S rRNA (uracil1498-N3)-methyltransferase